MSGEVSVCLALRPMTPADRELLYRIYASTRIEELAVTGWDDSLKAAFLQMQFDAQHRYYMENYRDARFQIIEWDRAPVGRLYLARWSDEIRIVDIALLPEYRGRGFGSAALAEHPGRCPASRAAGHDSCGALQPGAQPLRTAGLPHG